MRRSTSHSSSISGNVPIAPSDAGNAFPTPASSETLSGYSPNQNQNPNYTIQPDPQNPDHRRSLPIPLPPAKCPLLCVFYAEFDIVVGPKVCFQSPHKFMHLDVDASDEDVHQALEETFQAVIPSSVENPETQPIAGDSANNNTINAHKRPDGKEDSYDYWNWTPKKTISIERDASLPSSGQKSDKQNANARPSGDDSTSLAHSRNTSFASSKGATQQGDASTIDTELLQNSIFAATSEYIITGNELANQTITVSTHKLHILSRPMIICDTSRYERNSLLFAVGFVLRRNVDPRPYWPCLSKLSSTFRSMEVESEFLSHRRTRPQIQIVLEDVLVSINSKQRETHLVLDDANMLNLKLFRPPPPPTPPIPDYAVPILLRPEWQLQMYDFDLTVNWIVPHIDGCKYLNQIAVSSEVDMEMVRACLRVLRHHGVLAYVDVFRYSNVYECTPLAMGLLNGTTQKKAEEVKDAAFWYSAKAKYARAANNARNSQQNSQRNSPRCSPSNTFVRSLYSHTNSLQSLDLSVQGSTAPRTSAERPTNRSHSEELPRSFPSRTGHITIREEHSMDEDEPPGITDSGITRNQPSDLSHFEQIDSMKKALFQIYSSCSRNQSFGEMLLSKIESKIDPSYSVDRVQHETNGDRIGPDMSIDWDIAFDYFDHRRLITFGLVHALIRRVHQYPLAHEITFNAEVNISREYALNEANDDEADDFNNIEFSPEDISPMAEAAVASAKMVLRWSKTHPASPLQQFGFPPPPHNSIDQILLNKLTQEEMDLKSRKLLLVRIASAMDGTRCDDELSCMFEIPIEKLIKMLKNTGRWNIISVFSCTS